MGNSGVGKSLLINKLRNVQHGMEGWAPTGIKETTMMISGYAFPNEPSVRLWDCPGAGTAAFPRDTYVADMGLRYLDRVIIVTAGRFTDIELLLMRELRGFNIPYCMVRTKVDIDVMNHWEDNGVSASASIAEIREDLQSRLGCDGASPYLVSLRDAEAYDFQRLLCDIFPRLSELRNGDSLGSCWEDAWVLPESHSGILSEIQGRWWDLHGTLYIVQG